MRATRRYCGVSDDNGLDGYRNCLQECRRRAGWKSGRAFAEAVGVNPSTYGQYESGYIELSLAKASMFADLLGCTIDELAGRVSPGSADDL